MAIIIPCKSSHTLKVYTLNDLAVFYATFGGRIKISIIKWQDLNRLKTMQSPAKVKLRTGDQTIVCLPEGNAVRLHFRTTRSEERDDVFDSLTVEWQELKTALFG